MHHYPLMVVTARNAAVALEVASDRLDSFWTASGEGVFDYGDVVPPAFPIDGLEALAALREHMQSEERATQECWDKLRALKDRMADPTVPNPRDSFAVKYKLAYGLGGGDVTLAATGTEIESSNSFLQLLYTGMQLYRLLDHIQDKRTTCCFVYNANLYDQRENTDKPLLTLDAEDKAWLVRLDLHS